MSAKKRPARPAAKRKPKRIRPRATAREISPANLIVEVLTQHRQLLVAAYDDWTASVIYAPYTPAEKLRMDADFMESRVAGMPSKIGGELADHLLESIRSRLKAGK